jgi:hypothetical protein
MLMGVAPVIVLMSGKPSYDGIGDALQVLDEIRSRVVRHFIRPGLYIDWLECGWFVVARHEHAEDE